MRRRLLTLHEAQHHAGLWTWDTDHVVDSVVGEGDSDAAEREAEISRGLAADDVVRDDLFDVISSEVQQDPAMYALLSMYALGMSKM